MVDSDPWIAAREIGQQWGHLLAGTGIVDKKETPIAGGPGKHALDTTTSFLGRSVNRDNDIDATTPAQAGRDSVAQCLQKRHVSLLPCPGSGCILLVLRAES